MAAIPRAPQMRIHKATGHARCRFQGREYWFGRAGTPEAEERYRAFLKRWAEAQDSPPPPPPTKGVLTFAGALAPYLAEIRGDATTAKLRTNSLWWRARSMAGEVEHLAGVRLADFGPKMMTAWLTRVGAKTITRGGQQVPRTRTHVRELATELLRLFEWAVREELLPPEKLVSLRTVPVKAGRSPEARKPVPDADVSATLPYLPPALAAVVAICRHSAARPGEVLVLQAATGKQVDVAQLLDAGATLQISDIAGAFEADTQAWQQAEQLRADVEAARVAHIEGCKADELLDAEIAGARDRLERLVNHSTRQAVGASYRLADLERQLAAVLSDSPRLSVDPSASDASIAASVAATQPSRQPAMAGASTSWE